METKDEGAKKIAELSEMKDFKPFIKQLIKYYYEELGNLVGGNLHIVLDDGNIEHSFIIWCKAECKKNQDSFGVFLADVLLEFTEDELLDMYETDWWGMGRPTGGQDN